MEITYTRTYFTQNIHNTAFFSQNFVSFFKTPEIQIKPLNFTKKHTKFLKENINKKIEHSFFTYKKNSGKTQNIPNTIWLKKESFNHILPITFVIKKILITTELTHKKQFIFLLKEILYGLQITTLNLYKETFIFKNILLNNKNYFIKETQMLNLFYQQYLSNIFFNAHINLNTISWKYSNKTQIASKIVSVLMTTIFVRILTQKNVNYNFNTILPLLLSIYKQPKKNGHFINNMHYKKLLTTFNGYFNIKFYNKNKEITVINPNKVIWKNSNKKYVQQNPYSTVRKNYFPLITQKIFKVQNTFLIKRAKNRYVSTPQIIYLLLRLEEKIALYNKNASTKQFAQELLNLYNTLHYQITNKQAQTLSTTFVLTNLLEILKIRNIEWKFLFLRAIKSWLQKSSRKSSRKTQAFFIQLWKKITNLSYNPNKKEQGKLRPQINYNVNSKINLLEPIKKQRNYQKQLNLKQYFTHKKLVLTQTKYNFQNNKNILARITNRPIKIFFINALSLTKFAFNLERFLEKKEKRSPTTFLQNIDRDLINKYKYIAIYIKDLIRICFIGMYLKKASFIAQFLAFQLGKLPRNRKETSFIKFIIKVVKTFAAEREEILGLRIKFNGRVNRWRRTKAIIGERGVIPLHTIQNQIEYGTAHAINRKGAVGIKIWIHYNLTFNTILKESILKYFTYSKRLAIKKKTLNTIYFLK